MNIYIATSGEYSDYTIEGAFLREEDARSLSLADDYIEVELSEGPADVRAYYSASWKESYDGESISASDRIYDGDDKMKVYVGRSIYSSYISVSGWDKERVLKVLGDEKAKFLAEKNNI
ncbi:hypothetical protein ABZV14_05940 [Streptosporangium canum]|uniref:hypothetical protein n=1 Tax=Streptosporangium canum TaxID=324952 RepID=UPI0033A5A289